MENNPNNNPNSNLIYNVPLNRTAVGQADPNTKKFILNIDDFLFEFKQHLMGYGYNDKGDLIKISTPIVNKEGANRIITLIMLAVNRHIILSDLEEKDIRFISRSTSESLLLDLIRNYKKYDLNLMNIKSLVVQIYDFVYAYLKRGIRGEERDRAYGKENLVQGKTNKGGLFGFLE